MTNTAEKLTLPLFMVKYNGDLLISTGTSTPCGNTSRRCLSGTACPEWTRY